MFEPFSHYLSYGATDQQTARELTGYYNGLVVPGTVASFQSDGTRGFVLTLSAYSGRTRYIIDPRFPLFQQRLSAPKKSHEALAERLGDPGLVKTDREPTPGDFDEDRVKNLAKNWLQFNDGYTTVSSKHFAKYAERLGESVLPRDSKAPEYILPPYAVAKSLDDDWWRVSQELWDSSQLQAHGTPAEKRLVRVIAASNAGALAPLLSAIKEPRAVIWCSKLDELDVDIFGQKELVAYGSAIREATGRGLLLFALYGGFFSVLLAPLGLRGSSHGIGYGEARDWVELPRSGPPPARYYLPLAHRYISLDLALLFWQQAPHLVECPCEECGGQSPGLLDYHGLMRHSVRCRQAEIENWSRRTPTESAELLDEASTQFISAIERIDVPRMLRKQAEQCYAHLEGWSHVLRELDR